MHLRNQHVLPAAALVACLFVTSPARAHQEWLMPNFFTHTEEKAWLSFDHTFGDTRFHADSGPGLYFQWWTVSPDQRKRSVPFLFAGKTRTVGEVELTEQGTYRLEAIEPNMVWTKLDIDGSEVWQPGPRASFPNHKIVESKIYFAKAMAYVSLGAGDSSVTGATGEPLEIVFQSHPNQLVAGESFAISLKSMGETVANHEILLYAGQTTGHDPTLRCTTDAEGMCILTPEHPGRYLLNARHEGPTPDDATTDGFSYRVSVALEMNPKASASDQASSAP